MSVLSVNELQTHAAEQNAGCFGDSAWAVAARAAAQQSAVLPLFALPPRAPRGPLSHTETPRTPSWRGSRGRKRVDDQWRFATVHLDAPIAVDAEVFKFGPRPVKKVTRAEDVETHARAVHIPYRCVDNVGEVPNGRLVNGQLHDDNWGGRGRAREHKREGR